MKDIKRINIDRLNIRLKGIPRESARAAADGLGNEILGLLNGSAGQDNNPGGTLRRKIARRVVDAIRSETRDLQNSEKGA